MLTEDEQNLMQRLMLECPPGTRIEFGVLAGVRLAMIAKHPGLTIGVDSFRGMPPSTDRDKRDGADPYHEGRLACPIDVVRQNIARYRNIKLIEGFVPAVLDNITETDFAFAHIDMDQYDSTLAALRWLEPRMLKGGIVCCDDWFAGKDWLAAGAINEYAKTKPIAGWASKKCFFRY
jgi:hypothetical protein